MKSTLLLALLITLAPSATTAADAQFRFKSDFLRQLVAEVPNALKGQDPGTGRFGSEGWDVRRQEVMFALAVAWATKSDNNPYYHDPKLLDVVMLAGDALADDARQSGLMDYRKTGATPMPWTYSRWVRAYALIKDAMPPERREKWAETLEVAYSCVSENCIGFIQNIPAYQASGLYIAGQALDRPEWCAQARDFLYKVAKTQDPDGYWSEHDGPVVIYNTVYLDALGTYYAYSHDRGVIPYLKRAAIFHSNFTYPDGRPVETIDERNLYNENLNFGNIGFCLTAEGRGYLANQLRLQKTYGMGPGIDNLAAFTLYGEEGPLIPTAAEAKNRTFVMKDKAMIRRKGPWFICLSALCSPISGNRWIQDRQNMVSVYHDKCSLILGGGNCKLQPLWSNFTVGDISLLKHAPGDTNPDFFPKGPLQHVPTAASLKETDPIGVNLEYGEEKCQVVVNPIDDNTLWIRVNATTATDRPVEGHITLRPVLSSPFRTELTPARDLNACEFDLSSKQAGAYIEHNGWRLTLPEGARVIWPAIPHYPYYTDGTPGRYFGRIVIALPFSKDKHEYALKLTVPPL